MPSGKIAMSSIHDLPSKMVTFRTLHYQIHMCTYVLDTYRQIKFGWVNIQKKLIYMVPAFFRTIHQASSACLVSTSRGQGTEGEFQLILQHVDAAKRMESHQNPKMNPKMNPMIIPFITFFRVLRCFQTKHGCSIIALPR